MQLPSVEPTPSDPAGRNSPKPRVRVLENHLAGRPVDGNALREAVAGALSDNGCAAVPGPGALRLRLVFDARGKVVKAEPARGQAASVALPACVRQAVRSVRLPGTTGGWLIVEIG